MSEVQALYDAVLTDRFAEDEAVERFGTWWSQRDPRAQELLDLLAKRGADDTALALLLRLVDHHRISRSAIRRLLIDEHDIADAEQATLALVAARIDQFEGRARFTTWLYQVAYNEARMLIRGQSRQRTSPVAEPEPTGFMTRLSSLVVKREVIEQALNDLPEQQRVVIVLREQEGLSYDEIAEALEVPVGTVRSRLNRARAALAGALRPLVEPSTDS
ncbi:MAG: RNA polymerase sigma factor [Dermatophilaceae bacterium]